MSQVMLSFETGASALDDLLHPLVAKWLSNAFVRGVTLRLEFPARAALWPEEIPPVRVLLDGLIGDAIDRAAPAGESVGASVSLRTAAFLRLSVRRAGSAGSRPESAARQPRTPTGRDAAFALLKEVVRAHCGRLLQRSSRCGELVRVDLPRASRSGAAGSRGSA